MRSRVLPNFNIGEGRRVSVGIEQSNKKTCVSALLDETLKKIPFSTGNIMAELDEQQLYPLHP